MRTQFDRRTCYAVGAVSTFNLCQFADFLGFIIMKRLGSRLLISPFGNIKAVCFQLFIDWSFLGGLRSGEERSELLETRTNAVTLNLQNSRLRVVPV